MGFRVKGAIYADTAGVVFCDCERKPEDAVIDAIESASQRGGTVELHYCGLVVCVALGAKAAAVLGKHGAAMQREYDAAIARKHAAIRADAVRRRLPYATP